MNKSSTRENGVIDINLNKPLVPLRKIVRLFIGAKYQRERNDF